MLALEGIKVIDLTHLQPGHLCTMILGDLGADIIKVEAPPDVGGHGAGLAASPSGESNRREVAFNALNRNKRCIGLNLRSEKGNQIFMKLIKDADVIVEGFRPGVVKRLGIDFDTVRNINPRIVYCSLSGYGQNGPYNKNPGHDINYLSISGILNLIGEKNGPPVIPMNLIADFAGASLHGVIGIQAALLAREKTGKGQYVDISYLDSAMTLLTMFANDYFLNNTIIKRGETALHGAYPYYGAYKAKDGIYISIGCMEPWFWVNLCRVLGKEEYASAHFVMSHMHRGPDDAKWSEISQFLTKTFLTKTSDEWVELLLKNDIPAAKVLALDGVFKDPQVVQRQMVLEFDHPTEGKVKQIGIAVKLSDTPGKVRKLAPLFGENTEEIMRELNYTEDQIRDMRKESVIA